MQQISSRIKLGTVSLMVFLVFLGFGFKNKTADINKYSTTILPATPLNNTSISGKQLFNNNCATCHGVNRQGNPPVFPSLVDINKKLNKKQIKSLLTTGRNIMPNFSQLSEQERNAIVNYLFGEPATSNIITELSAEENGEITFIANCARCHQTIPTDKIPPDQKRMGRKPPVLGGISYKYNESQFKKILNTGPMYMPSFIALTNKEKEEIYTYLNSIEVNSIFLQPKKRRGCNMKN